MTLCSGPKIASRASVEVNVGGIDGENQEDSEHRTYNNCRTSRNMYNNLEAAALIESRPMPAPLIIGEIGESSVKIRDI